MNVAPIAVDGLFFGSFHDTQEWVRSQVPSGRYEFFLDAISYLEVLAGSDETAFEEVMKTKEWSHKGRFEGVVAAKVVASFIIPMPSVFGRIPTLDSGQQCSMLKEFPLPAVRTADVWSHLRPGGGEKEKIAEAMETHATSFYYMMKNTLSGDACREARVLSQALLRESSRFISKFCLWVDRTNNEMIMLYKLDKIEAWKMTCSCASGVITYI